MSVKLNIQSVHTHLLRNIFSVGVVGEQVCVVCVASRLLSSTRGYKVCWTGLSSGDRRTGD